MIQFLCLVLRAVALLSCPNLSLFWKMEKALLLLSAATVLTSSKLFSNTLKGVGKKGKEEKNKKKKGEKGGGGGETLTKSQTG